MVTAGGGVTWSHGDPCKKIVFPKEEVDELEKLGATWLPISLEMAGWELRLHVALWISFNRYCVHAWDRAMNRTGK